MLPVFLPTDFVAWGLFVLLILAVRHVRRSPELARRWRMVFARPSAAASAAVLAIFLLTALMDSIHWRDALPPADASDAASAVQAYSPEVKSLLDVVILERLKGQGMSAAIPCLLRFANSTRRRFLKTDMPYVISSRSKMRGNSLGTVQGHLNW